MTQIHCKTLGCRKWKGLNKDGFCPTCKPPSIDEAIESDSEECPCTICDDTIDSSDGKLIKCDLCKHLFHLKCVGSENLVKLLEIITLSNSEGSSDVFHGNFCWFCPTCLKEPVKVVELSKDSCKLSKPQTPQSMDPPVDNRHGNNSSTISDNQVICKSYRHGKCTNGDKCRFSHPPKCLQYCRYGRDGCGGGFSNCKLLHPVLCRGSLNYGKCFDSNCTLAHLKGTIRYRENAHFNYRPNPQTKSHGNYSKFDSKHLGFHSYRQTQNQNRFSRPTQRIPAGPNFELNQEDFPNLQNQKNTLDHNGRLASRNKSCEDFNFLEIMKTIQSMQEAQKVFHQELLSVKNMFPPPHPQRTQSQMLYSQHPHFNQQTQYPATQNQEIPV